MKEDILVFGLHHPPSVLSHCGDDLEQVHLPLLLQLLNTNVCPNEHTSATNTSTAQMREGGVVTNDGHALKHSKEVYILPIYSMGSGSCIVMLFLVKVCHRWCQSS